MYNNQLVREISVSDENLKMNLQRIKTDYTDSRFHYTNTSEKSAGIILIKKYLRIEPK